MTIIQNIKRTLKAQNKKNLKSWLKNEPKTLTDSSARKIYRWQINMKKFSTLYVIEEMQIETTKYNYVPTGIATTQNTDNSKS